MATLVGHGAFMAVVARAICQTPCGRVRGACVSPRPGVLRLADGIAYPSTVWCCASFYLHWPHTLVHTTACVPSPTASSSFMADAAFPEGRKLLALYPVLLFYLSLAWMVLIGFQQGPSAAVATVPVPTLPLATPLPDVAANITREGLGGP